MFIYQKKINILFSILLILVTMGDEAQAYICFCAVMKRLYPNFLMDGIAMTQKFSHLSEALQFYDPEFFEYLKSHQADDLLFCYRWLLLEMKREFAFEDSLRMLEVLWSSLPPEPPNEELQLCEKEFTAPPAELQPPPKSPSAVVMRTRENAYTKLCAIRRQSSSQSLLPTSPNTLKTMELNSTGKSLDSTKRLNHSLDENITRKMAVQGRSVTKSFQSLDETKLMHNQSIESKLTAGVQTDSDEKTVKRLEVEKNEKNDQLSRSTSPHRGDSETSSEVTSPKTCKNANHIHRHHSLKQHSSHLRRAGGGHFKELKERLAAGKKGIFASLDKIENFQLSDLASTTSIVGADDKTDSKGEKIVKNFNEFLNFTSNRSISSPKLLVTRTKSSGSDDPPHKPTFRPAKPSLDDSDSSSVAESSSATSNNQIENSITPATAVPTEKINFSFEFQQNERKHVNLDGSSPDDSQEYFPMTTSMTRELRLELDSLNRQVFGSNFTTQFTTNNTCDTIDCLPYDECDTPESESHISNNKSPAVPSSEISYIKLNQNSTDLEDEQQLDKIYRCPSDKNLNGDVRFRSKLNANHNEGNASKRVSTSSVNADVFVWENPLHQLSPIGTSITTAEIEERIPFLNREYVQTLTPDEQNELEYDGEIIDENSGKKSITPIRLLRKNGNDDNVSLSAQRSNTSSKRNSSIYRNDSESDSSSEMSINDAKERSKCSQKTIAETNPFLMDIRAMTISEQARPSDNNNDSQVNSPVDEEGTEANIILRKVGTSLPLPPPNEFGGGNPFLMFLCLTLLLQHRNYVMKNNMDYNEMAMHFDKMVRKHNVNRVLNQARRMYAEYLKSQNVVDAIGGEMSGMSNSIGDSYGSENAGRLSIDDKACGDNPNIGSSNISNNKQKF